jgi:hypothetical protein
MYKTFRAVIFQKTEARMHGKHFKKQCMILNFEIVLENVYSHKDLYIYTFPIITFSGFRNI